MTPDTFEKAIRESEKLVEDAIMVIFAITTDQGVPIRVSHDSFIKEFNAMVKGAREAYTGTTISIDISNTDQYKGH
jgi:hypothetical protein